MNDAFLKNGFKKISDDSKKIVISINNENYEFDYETNTIYEIDNTGIKFAVCDNGRQFFFINKSQAIYHSDEIASPTRTYYPGLIDELFKISYFFDKPIKIETEDNVIIDVKIENK